ncbi:hypothetical protein Bsp3421_002813 [Burkholderia sp. FERM BP-3421]|uniref:hypothetical protein n=1 Tax=Burkholderia sp. FERM BP-3421 TaxID=1494466 RepID=UPI002360B121|nr:hypothetical protein [Burkholderia sp. FERM BP-3421]WDD92784.1 hypothetical protein Bsp3421_002813 [Burkholderia sp. FERM BP-3421]
MSTTQFGRKASLVVGPAAGDALDLSALRFSFEIRRDDIQTLNRLHVRIFNVSDNTANRLQGEEFTRVVLQAGYAQGAYGVIFDGNITQTRRGRSSPTETVIEIDAASGDDWYTNAVVEQTFAGGSTSMDHVQAAIETMKPYGLSVGYLPAFEVKPAAARQARVRDGARCPGERRAQPGRGLVDPGHAVPDGAAEQLHPGRRARIELEHGHDRDADPGAERGHGQVSVESEGKRLGPGSDRGEEPVEDGRETRRKRCRFAGQDDRRRSGEAAQRWSI